jgi:putative transposase
MNNNWHLLVQTPLANLSEFMRRFNITYTSHYNRRHKRVGQSVLGSNSFVSRKADVS